MKITYYGHSCFAVDTARARLLFDPFITPNPLAEHIDVEAIQADYILISHAHVDHTADAVKLAKQTGATVLANYEIAEWLSRQGVENVHAMNHGGTARFEFGWAKMVSAIHTSSFPDGTYGGNPGGYVVHTDEGTFYFSGDTALTMDMQLVAAYGPVDFAVLCIGDTFTMGVDDAIRAAKMVGTETVFGVHYDTFPPIKIDHQQAVDRFAEAGLRLHLSRIGDSFELP